MGYFKYLDIFIILILADITVYQKISYIGLIVVGVAVQKIDI